MNDRTAFYNPWVRTALTLTASVALTALGACAKNEAPAAEDPAPAADAAQTADQAAKSADQTMTAPVGEVVPEEAQIPADTIATAFGKGSLERDDGKLASFTVDVNFRPGNVVGGKITYTTFLDDGKIDLVADVNCGHYDVESKRAWFGGAISENKSNKADAKDGRFAVGQPVWFRFEESDQHPEPAAQVSDLSMAGDDGYDSAADFCDAQPWSEDGLRDLSAQGAVIIFALPEGMGGQ